MSYRVVQWATGNVGRAAIEGVLNHPDLELAGCWVHSADKDGVDVGTLVGREPIGIAATRDVDALLALDADCVVYSPIFADVDVVTRLLESGKNVVTPLGWFYPPSDERAQLDAICQAAGVTLHGTGIHPGGITERFPLMVSALSGSITRVRAEEFSDIRTYGAPDVIRDWMLFGTTPEKARTSIMADALGAGFGQSVHMVADELGFDTRPRAADHARDGGRHRPDRLAHRADRARPRRRAALPLGGPGRRRTGGHGRGQLAHGRRPISTRRGASARTASASRSRSRATPTAWSRSASSTPPRSRPASSATRASWRRRCTASTRCPTCAQPHRACARISRCRWSPVGPPDQLSLRDVPTCSDGTGRD